MIYGFTAISIIISLFALLLHFGINNLKKPKDIEGEMTPNGIDSRVISNVILRSVKSVYLILFLNMIDSKRSSMGTPVNRMTSNVNMSEFETKAIGICDLSEYKAHHQNKTPVDCSSELYGIVKHIALHNLPGYRGPTLQLEIKL